MPALPVARAMATVRSGSSTASSTARTVTVCAVAQSLSPKLRVCAAAKLELPWAISNWPASSGAVFTLTVTSASGRFASATVKAASAPPSVTVTALCETARAAASASVVRALAVVAATRL